MSLAVSEKQAIRFERGFKTWCENTSVSIRQRIGVATVAPLRAALVAKHVGARLWTPEDVSTLSPETLSHLLSEEGDEWSAVTIRVGTLDVIVYNPTHSPARQASDLMHELAHIIRQHKPAQVFVSEQIGLGIRTFDPLQEAEANWLAACLLLPRPALTYCASRNMDRLTICEQYGVSNDILRMRISTTGVNKQFPGF